MIVLDASSLIAQLDEHDAHHRRARELLLGSADERLVASVVTLAEVLVGPTRAGRREEAEAALRELGIEAAGLPADAASSLALLRAETGLRLPDCCVLHEAATSGAECVATFDERLARAAAARGLKTPGEPPPARSQ